MSTVARHLLFVLCIVACTRCTAADRPAAVVNGKRAIAVLHDERISESSGLAISHVNPEAFWTHNDSGNGPQLFLVGLNGKTQAKVTVRNASSTDWEDICTFQLNGESWLLIADVGDNQKRRSLRSLYLLREPVVQKDCTVPQEASIEFTFPGGPADCEAVAVDVDRGEILLLTKTLGMAGLHTLPLNTQKRQQNLRATRIGTLVFPMATGMDVSVDGRQMVVCNYGWGVHVTREQGQTWAGACAGNIRQFALPIRPQGEAICFGIDGRLYLNSEGVGQTLWRLQNPMKPKNLAENRP